MCKDVQACSPPADVSSVQLVRSSVRKCTIPGWWGRTRDARTVNVFSWFIMMTTDICILQMEEVRKAAQTEFDDICEVAKQEVKHLIKTVYFYKASPNHLSLLAWTQCYGVTTCIWYFFPRLHILRGSVWRCCSKLWFSGVRSSCVQLRKVLTSSTSIFRPSGEWPSDLPHAVLIKPPQYI